MKIVKLTKLGDTIVYFAPKEYLLFVNEIPNVKYLSICVGYGGKIFNLNGCFYNETGWFAQKNGEEFDVGVFQAKQKILIVQNSKHHYREITFDAS